jgi:hypothetical protein
LVMTLWVRRKPTTGLTGLKMAELQLTMTKVLDKLQPAQRQKMLQKCVRSSARTVGKRSITFATLWNCHRDSQAHFVGQTQHEVDCCKLGAPSRQCASAHRFGCAAVFGLQKHEGHPPPTLLAWFSPL